MQTLWLYDISDERGRGGNGIALSILTIFRWRVEDKVQGTEQSAVIETQKIGVGEALVNDFGGVLDGWMSEGGQHRLEVGDEIAFKGKIEVEFLQNVSFLLDNFIPPAEKLENL
jgi:hypothetical protein